MESSSLKQTEFTVEARVENNGSAIKLRKPSRFSQVMSSNNNDYGNHVGNFSVDVLDKKNEDNNSIYQKDDGGQEKYNRSFSWMKLWIQYHSLLRIVIVLLLMTLMVFCILYYFSTKKYDQRRRHRFQMIDNTNDFIGNERRIDSTVYVPIQIHMHRQKLNYVLAPNPQIGEIYDYSYKNNFIEEEDSIGINKNVSRDTEIYSKKMTNTYYAFDDDEVRGKEFESKNCRRTSFQRMHNPTCNSVHELEMGYEWNQLVGAGYYRSAFRFWEDDYNDIIIKTIRFPNHEFDHWNFEFQRNDAMMMNLLQTSHHVVNIYGHCSGTVVTESALEDMSDYIVPFGGYLPKAGLSDEHDVDPLNNLTVAEKLDIALEMAECLSDMHNFDGGVLVHDDVQISQFWRGKDGYLKIIDFNRAEAMLFDTETETYCKYLNGPVWGNYRSPEEVNVHPLDEQIDVYSWGNNLYAILTGLWIYYYDNDDTTMQHRIKHGQVSYIDPRYRSRSFGEAFITRLLEICWFYNPQDRPSMLDIIDLLEKAIAWNNKLESEGKDTNVKDWMPILDEMLYVIHT